MKLRPCLIFFLIGILCITIPLRVIAQEDNQSWDIYQTTWTTINYENLTNIEIKHAVNGSLVSDNQKLNFIVVPFDVDELNYKIDVYKNDILMFTCKEEKVYDLEIYTTNPIEQIVTIKITLNNNPVLVLEYWAILEAPSLSADYTEEWLALQEEKGKEESKLYTEREKLLGQIDIAWQISLWSLLFAIIAFLVVITFQIIKPWNLATYSIWFISALIWFLNMRSNQEWYNNITYKTAETSFVFWGKSVLFSVIIIVANIFWLFSYVITTTRLEKKEFWAYNLKERIIKIFPIVIGRNKDGKICIRKQDFGSAFKRLFQGVEHEIKYDTGNFNEDFKTIEMKEIPENVGPSKHIRRINYHTKALNEQIIIEKNTKAISNNPKKKKMKIKKPSKNKKIDEKDFEIWKVQNTENLINKPSPICFIDGEPQYQDIYDSVKSKEITKLKGEIDEMVLSGSSRKEIKRKQKQLSKLIKTPIRHIMKVKLTNASIYTTHEFLNEAKTFEAQGKLIDELVIKNAELEAQGENRAYDMARDIITTKDRAIEQFEKEKQEVKT